MTRKQERFMWTEINFLLGKNGCHTSSGLGSVHGDAVSDTKTSFLKKSTTSILITKHIKLFK